MATLRAVAISLLWPCPYWDAAKQKLLLQPDQAELYVQVHLLFFLQDNLNAVVKGSFRVLVGRYCGYVGRYKALFFSRIVANLALIRLDLLIRISTFIKL